MAMQRHISVYTVALLAKGMWQSTPIAAACFAMTRRREARTHTCNDEATSNPRRNAEVFAHEQRPEYGSPQWLGSKKDGGVSRADATERCRLADSRQRRGHNPQVQDAAKHLGVCEHRRQQRGVEVTALRGLSAHPCK